MTWFRTVLSSSVWVWTAAGSSVGVTACAGADDTEAAGSVSPNPGATAELGGSDSSGDDLPAQRWGMAGGEWLLFDSDANLGTRNVYAAQLGTDTVLVIPTSTSPFEYPALSDDGQMIAMVRNTPSFSEIVTHNSEALGFYTTEEQASSPSWAPDRRAIAYVAGGSVVLLDLDLGENAPVEIESSGAGPVEHVRFTADGERLVISRGTEIRLISVQGQDLGAIVEAGQVPVTLSDVDRGAETILFDAACPDDPGVRSANLAETVAACDAPLATPAGIPARRGSFGPGASIAYEVGSPGTEADIWVLPEPDAEPVQLTNGPGDHRNPAFAPQGFVAPAFLSGGPQMWPTVSP